MKDTLLDLIRERRKYEVFTLDGYKPKYEIVPADVFAGKMYCLLSDEIEIEMKTIGGQNKTRLRKEAEGNPHLKMILKRGECAR